MNTMVKENLKVPKLRFGEFSGAWERKALDKFVQFKAGYAFKSTKMNNTCGEFQIVKMSNVYQNKLQLDRNSSFISNLDKTEREYILQKGDVLLTLTGTVGKNDYGYSVAIANEENLVLNQRLVLLRQIPNISDKGFIRQLLLSTRFLYLFFQESKGGTGNQTNVSIEDVKKIKLNLPTLAEQEKIANYLSALDEKLNLLSEKEKNLAQYKKAMMQKLFAQEIRFKDDEGKEFEAWEEKKLGEVGNIVSGLTYSPNDIDENGILVLRSSNIKDNKLVFSDNVYVNTSKFNPVMLDDILICVRNGSKDLIGKNALITNDAVGMAFGAFMSIYRSKANRYIYQWMQHSDYKKVVNRNLGATINSINGNDLKEFKIPYPCLAEQEKIAQFLSAIDEKINAVQKQIAAMQEFKKAMLQQMFV